MNKADTHGKNSGVLFENDHDTVSDLEVKLASLRKKLCIRSLNRYQRIAAAIGIPIMALGSVPKRVLARSPTKLIANIVTATR